MTGFAPAPVVGMASAAGPPSAQSCRFAISSVFRTGIGSCSSGSGRVGGGVTKLAVGTEMVLGPSPGVPAYSGWSPVGLRRLRNSLSIFSIFWL